MRSEMPTLLSISEWVKILGVSPWFTAQFKLDRGDTYPPITTCDEVIFEYMWQDRKRKVSRYEIARAINEAEFTFAKHMGYWPAPQYIANEEINYPRPSMTFGRRTLRDVRFNYKKIPLRYKYLVGFGKKVLTHIEDVDVVLDDADGDGIDESFEAETTILLPADLTLASEIEVYFTAVDRLGQPRNQWQIRPLEIEISGAPSKVTIKGASYLLVKPSKVLGVNPAHIKLPDTSSLVGEISIYRATINAAVGGDIYFNEKSQSEAMTSFVDNYRNSVFSITNDSCKVGVPDRVVANYLAGYPRQDDGRMDYEHAQIIAWLSAAYLQCTVCGCACDGDDDLLDRWTKIPSLEDIPMVTRRQMEESFGLQTGAIEAWKAANRIRERDGWQ